MSELSAELADSVRRALEAAGGTVPARRALDEAAFWRSGWDALRSLGVGELLLPDSGADLADVGAVCAELGRVCAPLPYIPSCVGAVTLLAALEDERLDAVAAGDLVVALDLDPAHAGSVPLVAGAAWADAVIKTHANGLVWLDLSGRGENDKLAETIDGTRGFGHTEAAPAAFEPLAVDWAAAEATRLARQRMAAATVADAVGAASRAFELADAYARTRQQFGVPVGSFQAVQHLLVDALTGLTLARSASEVALRRLSDAADEGAAQAVGLAAALATENLPAVVKACLQVFAGIGYTWEHDIGLFYKRMLSLPAIIGGSEQWLETLAAEVLPV